MSLSWSTQRLSLRPLLSVRVRTDKMPISLPFAVSPVHRDGRGENTFENVFMCISMLICVHIDFQVV